MLELKMSMTEGLTKCMNVIDLSLVRRVNKAIQSSAYVVQATAKVMLQKGQRTGRLYKRGKKMHRASAPQEPPKTDTGRLVSSTHIHNRFLETDIGSDVGYSSLLETGTQHMQPRPWLQSSLDNSKNDIERFLQKALKSTFS